MNNIRTDNTINSQAELLAEVIFDIVQWPKSNHNYRRFASNLVKLPPIFLGNDQKHGEGKRNLVAMIKVVSEYEEGDPQGNYPTLTELPARYNSYGGMPVMSEKDMRKVHSWMQSVSFALRAAILDQELKKSNSRDEVVQEVYKRLYANNPRRAFVTYAANNRYEIKPLRYASEDAKRRWIAQELDQKQSINMDVYGAQPSLHEWEAYGLRGQSKTACAAISDKIDEIIQCAEVMDQQGRYAEADALDYRIAQMIQSLQDFERLEHQSG